MTTFLLKLPSSDAAGLFAAEAATRDSAVKAAELAVPTAKGRWEVVGTMLPEIAERLQLGSGKCERVAALGILQMNQAKS